MSEAGWLFLWGVGAVALFHIAASLHQIAERLGKRSEGGAEKPREIQTVVAGPNDIVLFRISKGLKREQREELREHLRRALSEDAGLGPKCIAIEMDLHVDAVIQRMPRPSAGVSEQATTSDTNLSRPAQSPAPT